MKKVILFFLVATVAVSSCNKNNSEIKTTLETENEKLSYALGLRYGEGLKQEGIELDWSAFITGMHHKIDDEEQLLDSKELSEMSRKTNKAKLEKRKQEQSMAKEKSTKFLEENKTKAGVTTTESGLQYEVLSQGDGEKPGSSDEVSVHYAGSLIDGTEFDSSIKRGKPISFRLNQVIKGWQEGLQLMPVGSKYKFYIPSEIGYGQRGAGKIPANSTLIFEVELLGIVK